MKVKGCPLSSWTFAEAALFGDFGQHEMVKGQCMSTELVSDVPLKNNFETLVWYQLQAISSFSSNFHVQMNQRTSIEENARTKKAKHNHH